MSYRKPIVQTLTIANGARISDHLRVGEAVLGGFRTPSILTNTSFNFNVCDTPKGTYRPLYDSAGNIVVVTVTVDRAYTLTANEADAIAPWGYLKFYGAVENEAQAVSIVTTKK